MKTRNFIAVQATMMVLLATTTYVAGKGGPCNNPSLQWEVRSSYPIELGGGISRITGDGKGAYTGVLNTCSGSGDATLQTGNQRQMTFNFGQRVAGSTPTWADPSGNVSGSAYLNLRSLRNLIVDASQEGEFTTWLGSNIPSPKGTTYHFRMFNPDADITGRSIISPEELAATNTPYVTSKVSVYHCPARTAPVPSGPCADVVKETWFVYPDPAPTMSGFPFSNVGSVVSSGVNRGQFEMPFYFVLSIP